MQRIIKPSDYLYYPPMFDYVEAAMRAIKKIPEGLIFADERVFPVLTSYKYNADKGRFEVMLAHAVDNSINPLTRYNPGTLEFNVTEQTIKGIDGGCFLISDDSKITKEKTHFEIKEYRYEFDQNLKYYLSGMNKSGLFFLKSGEMYRRK